MTALGGARARLPTGAWLEARPASRAGGGISTLTSSSPSALTHEASGGAEEESLVSSLLVLCLLPAAVDATPSPSTGAGGISLEAAASLRRASADGLAARDESLLDESVGNATGNFAAAAAAKKAFEGRPRRGFFEAAAFGDAAEGASAAGLAPTTESSAVAAGFLRILTPLMLSYARFLSVIDGGAAYRQIK